MRRARLLVARLGVEDELVRDNERMPTRGFYAEVDLDRRRGDRPGEERQAILGVRVAAHPALQGGRPGRPLDGRKRFNTAAPKGLLLRSIGREPTGRYERNRDAMLLRMVLAVENHHNLLGPGPGGTGESHLYRQILAYAHLVSEGKATVARLSVNNASGRRELVWLYDVVCFDEVSGVSFDQKAA